MEKMIFNNSTDNVLVFILGYKVLVQLSNSEKLQSTASLQSPMLKPIKREIQV